MLILGHFIMLFSGVFRHFFANFSEAKSVFLSLCTFFSMSAGKTVSLGKRIVIFSNCTKLEPTNLWSTLPSIVTIVFVRSAVKAGFTQDPEK